MDLLANSDLENSDVVANCNMNRERSLVGGNGYDQDLGFNPMDFLRSERMDNGANWLDLCCGTGKALAEAAVIAEAENLPLQIHGVDLVDMFVAKRHDRLEYIVASLSHWRPKIQYDLITCVHGLHYIGDKLDLVARCATWLKPKGTFVANLDSNNICVKGNQTSRAVISQLRKCGFKYSYQSKLIRCDQALNPKIPFRYLGADDQAGPNYTGQPAVNSHYERLDSST